MRRRVARHLARLHAIVAARVDTRRCVTRLRQRGFTAQRHRRQAQRQVRVGVVATATWLQRRGDTREQTAARLGLNTTTLKSWQAGWRLHRLTLRPRGRPAQHADRSLRAQILELFRLAGPGLGVPALQSIFPDVARAELAELARRYRYAYRRLGALLLYALRWTQPGRVWAIDFTDPPSRIDGQFDKLLVVKDLASGYGVDALPAPAETADLVAARLDALFLQHGAPLVLKSDNGGPFVGEPVAQLLARHRVLPLTSPPRTPRYNGSIEAGIGALKTRAHYEAARNDRPGHWICDDVEAARCQANTLARPFGPTAATPEVAWRHRAAITSWEREAFHQVYDARMREQPEAPGVQRSLPFGQRCDPAAHRVALTRALIEGAYLLVRRRRVSLPIPRHKAIGIT